MAENQLEVKRTSTQATILDFNKKVNGNYVQNQLKAVLKENAGTFTTSLVELFTGDAQLQSCDTGKVVQEAMKAASMKLPINKNLGYAYIIVFNNYDKTTRTKVPTPQMVIGYKGLLQLAYRTGYYTNINADIVYEGELKGKDKLSGMIDLSGEKISNKVVGYFAYFELKSGIKKTLYVTLEEMAAYALKYSPTFKARPKDGKEITPDFLCEQAQLQSENGPTQGQVGWNGDFNAMAQKTVLRRLLSKYGYLSIEMMDALSKDEQPDSMEQATVIRDTDNTEEKPRFDASQLAEEAKYEEVKEEAAPI